MKTPVLKVSQIRGKGAHGLYFKQSPSKGVKITGKGYESRKTLKSRIKTSKKLQKVIKEATIGLLAGGATLGVEIVKYQGRYFLGINQRHLSSNKEVTEKTLKFVKDSLRKKKVLHGDLHFGNVRFFKGLAVAVDFDSDYAIFVGKKNVYYTVKNRLIKKVLRKGS